MSTATGATAASSLEPTSLPSSREAALVSVGQGAIMLCGGVLALLVAQNFGNNTETDAFFVAYSFYSIGLVLTQTFRLSAVSKVVHDPGPVTATTMLGAAAMIVLIAAVPMVGLAGPLSHALVASDPTGSGPPAMRFLWIALAGQLMAAMLAMFLSARGLFVAQGLVMVITGAVSLGVYVLLRGSAGIDAASIALAAAGVWFAAALAGVLWRVGWRPAAPSAALARRTMREACALLAASLTFVGAIVAYVLSLAIAGREGPGKATLYAYAFVLASIVVGLTANIVAMVRSPSLVASADRTGDAVGVGERSLRYTLILGGPALGLLLLVGAPLLKVALGYSSHDTWLIAITAGCLAGWVVGWAAGVFAVVELLARGEHGALAGVAVGQVAGAMLLAWAGSVVAGIAGVAVGLSLSSVGTALVQLRLAFGPRWSGSARRMARDCGRQILTIVAASAPSAVLLLVANSSTGAIVVAGLLACPLMIVATRLAWPDEFLLLAAIVRR